MCNEIEIKAYFHFSHHKSIETMLPLRQKHMSNSNKNTIYVEANVMNISTTF